MVILVGIALTALAGIENVAPWAPFFLGYATLALIIPLATGSGGFAWPRHRLRALVLAIAGGVVLQIAVSLLLGFAWPAILALFGVPEAEAASAVYQPGLALEAVFAVAAPRLGLTISSLQSMYIYFIMFWAAVGEELLYRGYIQGSLAPHWGTAAAALAGALFFALRHPLQLLLLAPAYPFGAAGAWFAVTLGVGLIFAYLYVRTQSLTVPVFVHAAFNLIPFLAVLGAG